MEKITVEEYLIKKGFNPALKGFDYIVKAVELIRNDAIYKRFVTTKLYPTVAYMFNDEPSKVERAMRHAIKSAGYEMTNTQFIAETEIFTR